MNRSMLQATGRYILWQCFYFEKSEVDNDWNGHVGK